MEFIPFARPTIGQDEEEAVLSCLRNGWLTTGRRCLEFESAFASFMGGDVQAVAVCSATAGLHLALEAVGVGEGDKVIVPSYTFTATAEVVRYLGAMPVLVDVEEGSLNLTADSIEDAVAKHGTIKAVMPVHFAGLSCDMQSIRQVCRRHGISIVEDAAHALPATHGGELVGSSGDCTVFSFYATKTITTGEGGMVVTSDPELARRMKCMRLHGIDRDAFDRYSAATPSWYYRVVAPGFKYNLTDMAAAIGVCQLTRAWEFQGRRAAIADEYFAGLEGCPIQLPNRPPLEDVHSWHLFVIRLEDPTRRESFIETLHDNGIGVSVHFIPLHVQPYWADLTGLVPEELSVSYDAYTRAVSLPIYPLLNAGQVKRIIDAVRQAL